MHNENNKNLKPKNLKKSLSRLIKELNKYKILIIISLLLAVVGSILSIITPNKLSKLTDEITKGLIINKDNFNLITIDDTKIILTSKICKFLSVIKKNNNKCVVWCVFIDTIILIENILRKEGYKVKSIYGNTPEYERNKAIDEFNYGELQIIITNPATLAESVSLHKACHEAHYLELNYNLYQYLQSRDRIHRLGLKPDDKTNYYIYINMYYDDLNKNIDMKIYNALRIKEDRMKTSIERGNFLFGSDSDIDVSI